jgi:hypothetical protein
MSPHPINRDQLASQLSPPNSPHTPPTTPLTSSPPSPVHSPVPPPPPLTRQVGDYYLLNQPRGNVVMENTTHRTPEQQMQIDSMRASNPGIPEYVWWPNEDFQYNREYLRSLIPASEFGPPPPLTRTLSDHSYGASEPSDYDDG